MALIKMKVTYKDGRVVEVLASPEAQVMTEEHFDGFREERRIASEYYLAWASLNTDGKESADYGTFLKQVADAGTVDAEEPDPTQSAQPSDTSSD